MAFHLSPQHRIPIVRVTVDFLATPLAFRWEAPGNAAKQYCTFWLGQAEGHGSLNMEQAVEVIKNGVTAPSLTYERRHFFGHIYEDLGMIYHPRSGFKRPEDFPLGGFPEGTQRDAYKTITRGYIGDDVPTAMKELILKHADLTFIWPSPAVQSQVNSLVFFEGKPFSLLLLDYVPPIHLTPPSMLA